MLCWWKHPIWLLKKLKWIKIAAAGSIKCNTVCCQHLLISLRINNACAWAASKFNPNASSNPAKKSNEGNAPMNFECSQNSAKHNWPKTEFIKNSAELKFSWPKTEFTEILHGYSKIQPKPALSLNRAHLKHNWPKTEFTKHPTRLKTKFS